MDENEMFDDENFDVESESDQIPKAATEKNLGSDVIVENAAFIPLFSDTNKRASKLGHEIQVTKVDNPGSGYKGRVDKSATLETIASLYGNGIYNFELINKRGTVIHTLEGRKISVPTSQNEHMGALRSTKADNGSNAISDVIRSVHISNEKAQERNERINKDIADKAIELSRQHTNLTLESAKASSERDREFMKGNNESLQVFFANMFKAQEQTHNHTLQMITAQHQMTLQLLLANQKEKVDPMQAMILGIKLAKDMDGDDSPPWLQALNGVSSGLGSLLQLKASTEASKNVLPPSNKPAKSLKNKKQTISKDAAKELMKLKSVLHSKGIDLAEALADASRQYSALEPSPSEMGEETGDDTDNDPDNDADETAETNVGNS